MLLTKDTSESIHRLVGYGVTQGMWISAQFSIYFHIWFEVMIGLRVAKSTTSRDNSASLRHPIHVTSNVIVSPRIFASGAFHRDLASWDPDTITHSRTINFPTECPVFTDLWSYVSE
jgi:hypothetical protein